jgi:TPR repeat protein
MSADLLLPNYILLRFEIDFGIKIDMQKAFELYQQSANLGCMGSQYDVLL